MSEGYGLEREWAEGDGRRSEQGEAGKMIASFQRTQPHACQLTAIRLTK